MSTTSLTVTPSLSCASSVSAPTPESTTDDEPMSVAIGEPLLSDYCVHELPSEGDSKESGTALTARLEYLEAKTMHLRGHINAKQGPLLFRIEQVAENDSLVKFYSNFASYALFFQVSWTICAWIR